MFDLGPDRGRFWSPPPDWKDSALMGRRWSLGAFEPTAPLTLVSGDISRLGALGPRDESQGESYALRLAPDKALLIGAILPSDLFASDMSDAFVFFDLTGESVADALAAATSYDFKAEDRHPTESCHTAFAGLRLLLGKRPAGWRMLVERAAAPTLHRFFQELMQ